MLRRRHYQYIALERIQNNQPFHTTLVNEGILFHGRKNTKGMYSNQLKQRISLDYNKDKSWQSKKGEHVDLMVLSIF